MLLSLECFDSKQDRSGCYVELAVIFALHLNLDLLIFVIPPEKKHYKFPIKYKKK